MQVSVESTGQIGRRMTVAVPAAKVEQEYSARLQRVQKNARLPGFRPGKAPMKIIEAQYGKKLMEEIAGDLIQSSFYEAVSSQGLRPAGGPLIERHSIARGQDFEYTAVFEIYPQILRLDIQGKRIERPVCEVQEADVDRTLESLRKQRVSYSPVERAAANDDQVTIDFVGKVDGEPFPGGEAKDYGLVLGEGRLIAGFEDGLVGARAGETRSLKLKFPAEYRNESLAGKPVEFSVTVKAVAEPVLPALDEAFVKQFNIQDGSVESLRKEIRSNLEREKNDRIRSRLREQVFGALIELNPFEIPKALAENEAQRMLEDLRSSLMSQGLPAESAPKDPSLYLEQAQRRVRLGLALAELIKAKGLSADAAAVRARVEEMGSTYESPEKFVEWHYAQPGRLAEIESMVLEEKAMEVLLESAEVVDKPVGFQELTQARPT